MEKLEAQQSLTTQGMQLYITSENIYCENKIWLKYKISKPVYMQYIVYAVYTHIGSN